MWIYLLPLIIGNAVVTLYHSNLAALAGPLELRLKKLVQKRHRHTSDDGKTAF